MPRRPGPGAPAWRSASELAEYAFCERAWYYRDHPTGIPTAPEDLAQEVRGRAYHTRELSRRVVEERSGAGLAGVALALLLLAVLLLYFGGIR
ncbi:MAG: hypothetical protein L3K04_00600 [Thermoplasmata archaeon]|nr:hypothetical protein [Thermoplasmata archaeon]MCI4338118.1 hypothetical protein [Thermoplasmata archaeon]MCI4340883.1 hypothetical protein [Thermoplasmata archaeon]